MTCQVCNNSEVDYILQTEDGVQRCVACDQAEQAAVTERNACAMLIEPYDDLAAALIRRRE